MASNTRYLCASPRYLAGAGTPLHPNDLRQHRCIVLRESDGPFGHWHLSRLQEQVTVKVDGKLSSNDGETTVLWALDGHGVIMRSEWDVRTHLQSGDLAVVLPDWSLRDADIFALYAQKENLPAKVSCFLDFLASWFAENLHWRNGYPLLWSNASKLPKSKASVEGAAAA